MKRKLLAILFTFIMVASLAACAAEDGTSQEPDTTADSAQESADEPEEPAVEGEEAPAADGEVLTIGAITSLSGALQDYGEQFQRGFYLGLEYMTDNTMTVAGRPIEVIWEDTTNTPEVAAERTLVLLETHNVDIVTGYASSGDAMASLALFEEFNTIAVIEPAAADTIIQAPNWNENIFRTGRTSGQDALALAEIIRNNHPDGNATIATIAPDDTFGYAMVEPFVAAVEAAGFEVTNQEFVPRDATDFTPFILRLRDAAPTYLYTIWSGANSPWMQLLELDIPGAGITIITGAPERAGLEAMIELGEIGGFGFCVYYYSLPQNEPMNDWLVARYAEVHGGEPDIFVSGGMAAASAIITALELSGGETDPEVLRPIMRGMEFDSPTGPRWFREEDHQAMQVLFEVEFTAPPGTDHMVPEWVRTIPAENITPPVMN
jgi:branched-chain amino acid transport system substrate-binding protein